MPRSKKKNKQTHTHYGCGASQIIISPIFNDNKPYRNCQIYFYSVENEVSAWWTQQLFFNVYLLAENQLKRSFWISQNSFVFTMQRRWMNHTEERREKKKKPINKWNDVSAKLCTNWPKRNNENRRRSKRKQKKEQMCTEWARELITRRSKLEITTFGLFFHFSLKSPSSVHHRMVVVVVVAVKRRLETRAPIKNKPNWKHIPRYIHESQFLIGWRLLPKNFTHKLILLPHSVHLDDSVLFLLCFAYKLPWLNSKTG